MQNIPYVYSIYCIPTGQYYYGVRYSKKSKPEDLWQTYFTSSSYVKELISKFGKENFIPKVRKVFTCPQKALEWEAKFLLKVNAKNHKKFINMSNGVFSKAGTGRFWINNGLVSKFVDSDSAEIYMNEGWVRGRIFDEQQRKKISDKAKERYKDKTKNPMYGKKRYFSQEHRAKLSESGKGKEFSEAHRKKISDKAKERYKDKTKNPMYGKKKTNL